MSIHRTIGAMTGESYFDPDFPLYVNRATESFELLEHSHDFVEVTYISEGKGFHYIGDQVIAVQKGDLFFIPVGISHVFRPAAASTKDRLIVYNCIFHEQFFARMATSDTKLWASDDVEALQALQNEKNWFVHREQYGEAGRLMNLLLLEFSNKQAARRVMLFSYALQLLVYLVRSNSGSAVVQTRAEATRLDHVLARLEQQLAAPPSLGAVATELNVSIRQMHRLMKKATGQTYMEYIHSLRMQTCCELLNQTNLKISLVAEQIGYKDMKYFHALFKRKTGLTPRQFRMKAKQEL